MDFVTLFSLITLTQSGNLLPKLNFNNIERNYYILILGRKRSNLSDKFSYFVLLQNRPQLSQIFFVCNKKSIHLGYCILLG